MKYKKFNKWSKNELKIYRFLGVNKFRKFILWFEKMKHHKNNKEVNENYHPSGFDVVSLERHNGFLLYNTFVHCVSLLFILAYLILTLIYDIRNMTVDAIMIVLSILNIYCIILQRMNYLKIHMYCYKYYQRYLVKSNLLKDKISRIICAEEPQKIFNDYELICKIRDAYLGKSDCFIKYSDIESMNRIYKCLESVHLHNSISKRKEVTRINLIDNCNMVSGPYTVLQLRVNNLQNCFRVKDRKMLIYTSIITENAECETLYKKIVPQDTLNNVCMVSCVLFEIYKTIVNRSFLYVVDFLK